MDLKTLARRALAGAVAGIAHPEAADEAASRFEEMVLKAGAVTIKKAARQMGIVIDEEGADDLDD